MFCCYMVIHIYLQSDEWRDRLIVERISQHTPYCAKVQCGDQICRYFSWFPRHYNQCKKQGLHYFQDSSGGKESRELDTPSLYICNKEIVISASHLSFRWVNILYAWTIMYSVSRLVKNQSPFPPSLIVCITIYYASSQECWNHFSHLHHKCQTTCLWYGWVNVRLGGKGGFCNVFLTNLFTELTVYAFNKFTHLKLR